MSPGTDYADIGCRHGNVRWSCQEPECFRPEPWRDPDPRTVEEDAEDTIALEAAMRRLRDGRRLEDYPLLEDVMAELDAEDAKRRRRVLLALGVGALVGFVAGWALR